MQKKVTGLKWAMVYGCVVALAIAVSAASPINHYLYMSAPDGAQAGSASGTGILVFDIDDGHKFVRRIEIPNMREGVRGFTGSLATHSVYYGTTNRRLGCFDLESEKVVWETTYEAGCDRSCITMDGKRLYVPTGWWYTADDGGFLVIDAATGTMLKRIPVGKKAHNSIASLDGRFVYLGTDTCLTVFAAKDDSVVHQIKPVGERGVFPFTIDSKNRYAYVCLGNHVGVDVVDLEKGVVIHRVLANAEAPIKHRTHGAGLTPDESELWLSDQDGKKLFIFDATKMPPVQTGSVALSKGGHGWICFSRDGRYAWCHTPDIFDVKTKQQVATFKDETGKPVAGSKFIEVHLQDGKVVWMGNEFGLGRLQP